MQIPARIVCYYCCPHNICVCVIFANILLLSMKSGRDLWHVMLELLLKPDLLQSPAFFNNAIYREIWAAWWAWVCPCSTLRRPTDSKTWRRRPVATIKTLKVLNYSGLCLRQIRIPRQGFIGNRCKSGEKCPTFTTYYVYMYRWIIYVIGLFLGDWQLSTFYWLTLPT